MLWIVPSKKDHGNDGLETGNEPAIPHVTLLDLDLGCHKAGWGRLRYAVHQLNQITESGNDPE